MIFSGRKVRFITNNVLGNSITYDENYGILIDFYSHGGSIWGLIMLDGGKLMQVSTQVITILPEE